MQAQGFDEYISEHLVSLNRSLPDRRDDWCKENVLVDPAYLPSTSVIMMIMMMIGMMILMTNMSGAKKMFG